MTDRIMAASPQVYARSGGALYLIIIAFGMFAEGFVSGKLIVSGDAAATAHNILASPSLWGMSSVANLIIPVLAVPLLMIEYLLLRPVDRNLALLALLFNIVSLAVESVSKLFLLAVLSPLEGAQYLQAFSPQQLQALSFLAYKSHDVAFNIALIFFGCTCLVNGYLIFRSGYLPRVVGLLMQVAGAAYLTACFAALFAPGFYDRIFPVILLPPFIGESSFCLWLLLKGVDVAEWKRRNSVIPA